MIIDATAVYSSKIGKVKVGVYTFRADERVKSVITYNHKVLNVFLNHRATSHDGFTRTFKNLANKKNGWIRHWIGSLVSGIDRNCSDQILQSYKIKLENYLENTLPLRYANKL